VSELEMLNTIHIEWSQITDARTRREIDLERERDEARSLARELVAALDDMTKEGCLRIQCPPPCHPNENDEGDRVECSNCRAARHAIAKARGTV